MRDLIRRALKNGGTTDRVGIQTEGENSYEVVNAIVEALPFSEEEILVLTTGKAGLVKGSKRLHLNNVKGTCAKAVIIHFTPPLGRGGEGISYLWNNRDSFKFYLEVY